MVSICNKLQSMVKDEKKGAKEYEELILEMLKEGLIVSGTERYIDILNSIEEDENRHKREINKIMKDLKCK